MFGPNDRFLVPLTNMLRTLPVFPMFGHGETRLQPAYVEDVAEAVARIVEAPEPEPIYELGGACTLRYKTLLERLREHVGRRTRLVPVPFTAWLMLGSLAEWLPGSPFTRNQVELMRKDNVAWTGPGFRDLGIVPAGVDVNLT
jgi:NADH dehydrogenase